MSPSRSVRLELDPSPGGACPSSQRLFSREGLLTLERDQVDWARFDLSGRWRSARVKGATYRRALAGKVIAVRSYRCGGDRFHDVEAVGPDEATALGERFREWALEGLDAFASSLGAPWRGALERACALDPDHFARDCQAFHEAYQGDPITPPDQAESILLQSTVGCAHNRCTFCNFYQGVRFAVRTEASFRRHVEEVRAYLGPTLQARHRIFLGDASALMVKPSLLARHMEAARTLLVEGEDDEPRGAPDDWSQATTGPFYRRTHPFNTFCDTFLTPLPALDDLRELERRGLDRVYLGVESGCHELLRFLDKPATPDAIVDAVSRLHQAGIRVSVILMVGVGGRPWAERHVEDTVVLLKRLGLRLGDFVQFSEYFCLAGSRYEADALRENIEPLSRAECRAQMRTIVERLGLRDETGGARVQMYDARQLMY